MKDTDDALRGEGAAQTVRDAFANAPVMRTVEEQRAVDAWLALLGAADTIEPTAATVQWERTLIGHVLAESPGAMIAAGDILQPDHFAQRELAEVFRVLGELFSEHKPLDPTAICERLVASSKVDAPWPSVLSTCQRLHTTASTATDKAWAVFGAWRNRRLASLGAALYHRARGAAAHDATEILDELTTQLVGLEVSADAKATDIGVGDAAVEVRQEISARHQDGHRLPGVPTGLERLNYYSGGFEPGCVYVVKADTGVGKSAFALSLALNIARASAKATRPEDQHRVAVVSLEMKPSLVALRVLANAGSVDGMTMRLAKVDNDEIDRMLRAERELRGLNDWLRINHSPGMSLSGLRRYLQRLAVRYGRAPSVVMIDYVQLLRVVGQRTREQEVAELSTGLKNLASDLGCAMVLLSQVNADGQARESRRIEHDADMVMQLMPEDSSADPVDLRFVYDLVIGKSRSGVTAPRGKYKVLFMKRYQRIVERADTDDQAGWWGTDSRPGAAHD